MRAEFKLSEEQLEGILEACKPVPYIMPQCGHMRSPQENANDAWKKVGKELGFDHMTVEPVSGKSREYITAEKVEPDLKGRVVIRFDGPPGPEAGRFVEVEQNGMSINFGEWVQDEEFWLLVLPESCKV